GVTGLDEAGDELDHLRDVPGRARLAARREHVEGFIGGGEGAFVLVGVGEPLPALLDGLRQDLVVDVGDIADHRHPIAAVEQPATQGVEDRGRTQMADMRFALHRGTADVDPHLTVMDGSQFLGRAAGGVVERDSHSLSLPGRAGIPVSANSISDCYAPHVMHRTLYRGFTVKWKQAMKTEVRAIVSVLTSVRAVSRSIRHGRSSVVRDRGRSGKDIMSIKSSPQREVFVSRSAFIFAAIGSAVGLGNIWRFPYVTYDNGGGAFIIPYLVALLTAGIPLLFFYYAMGHRSRGSAPLAYRMTHKAAEPIGWFATGVAIIIGIYYAAIIGWAGSYMFFSLGEAWGDDAEGFLFGEYLKMGDPGISFEFVPGVLIPLIIVWIVVLGVLLMGVQNGIAGFSKIFIPLLIVLFLALVIRALFLPGAADGLNALFTPDFAALTDPSVWLAAYGQIFFSLSIAFGIMITYASYLKKKTNLTGAGLVVGFSNSAFEILAGIGIFAALGFMATAQGVAVGDVASDGIGLAFVGF